MADQKFYVQDGKAVTANRRTFAAGAEVSNVLGQEKCKKFEAKGIVSTTKPDSLLAQEKNQAAAAERAAKRSKNLAAASKPVEKKAEKPAEKPAEKKAEK